MSTFNLDAISASTHARIEKKWQDNLSVKTPMAMKFTEKEGKYLVDGGKELTFPVILDDGNAGSYYGDDPINIARPSGLQPLTFQWKQFASSVRIDGIEEIMSSGEGLGAELFEGRMKQAELTTSNAFERMLCGDGTGNGSKDWNGLQNIVADDPTTGTIGGLARATYPQIRNQAYLTTVTAFNTAQAGRNAMTTLWANCTNGGRSPNFAVTTVAIWTLFNLSLTANERFVDVNADKKLLNAGFQSIAFMGMPVVFSSNVLTAHLYMLRVAKPKTDGGIFMCVSKQRDFKLMPFQRPVDQDMRVALSLSAGQLGTDAPYLQGVITNITG